MKYSTFLHFVGMSVWVEANGSDIGLSFGNEKRLQRTLRIDKENGKLYVLIDKSKVEVIPKWGGNINENTFVAIPWESMNNESEDAVRLEQFNKDIRIQQRAKKGNRKSFGEQLDDAFENQSKPKRKYTKKEKEITQEERDEWDRNFDAKMDEILKGLEDLK